ncbi:MAG: hypothetical protein WC279_12255 [Sulfurimonas sp.]|jgi:hypothetical protein
MPIKEPKNPTKLEKVVEIRQETERFLKRLGALESELRMDKDSGSRYFTRTSLSAAVKRSGMDLRRALSELRFFGVWR